jgi:2-polyprenyl-6-methoxyphenol hydroxylase-like FAD-dependent oxidoreductase
MKTIEMPVLICGGGPVGLSAAILLARLGVRSMLV